MRKQFFLVSILFSLLAFAEDSPLPPFFDQVESPWFTGPLLASSSTTLPLGHVNFEPYVFVLANTAVYNHHWKPIKTETLWNAYFQPQVQTGLTHWMDFQVLPTFYYNWTDGAASWVVGDMPVQIGFQLYKNSGGPTDWATSLKLNLSETFPIGAYQNLSPKKKLTDLGGEGSWQTTFGLSWGNLFYLGRGHFMSTRLSLQYNLPAPVQVKGINAFGGEIGARSKVYPPQNFYIDLGLELSLTQNWAFAMDLTGSWSGKTRFKVKNARRNSVPPSTQFTLAPALEYSWNDNLGIIFGSWFTVAGRNTHKFQSGVFALNYYY